MGEKIRVFMAEAEKSTCNSMRDCFESVTDMCLVGIESDGIKAAETISTAHPDVIVLDLALPGLDGFGVMEEISNMTFDVRPIIMVTTANTRYSASQLAFELGAELIMFKPYKAEDLITRIRAIHKAISVNRELGKDIELNKQVPVKTLKQKVESVLDEYGVPTNISGYRYLLDSFIMVAEKPETVDVISKYLYPQVADKHETSAINVERGIRIAIKKAWSYTPKGTLQKLYGNAVDPKRGRPTNTEFISNVARKFQVEETSQYKSGPR